MPAKLTYVVAALLFGALLLVRIDFLLAAEAAQTVPHFAGTAAQVAGVVVGDPDVRAASVRVVIAVESVNGAPESGMLLAALPPNTAVAYGDKVVVRGAIAEPQAFETNTGRLFDYPGYLRARGIFAVMQKAQVLQAAHGGASLVGFLFNTKHAFERALARALPEPQVFLLDGILLGDRGGLSNALLQAFVVVGLIHLVVLSGSNIAVVSEAIFRALGFLPPRVRYLAGGAAIVLFAVMTGGGSATVRAVIMGGIAIVARYLRRPNDALRALVAAAALMLLFNPLVVLDNGFVLSVLATFGLITLSPAIERRLTLLPAWRQFNVRSIVATTLGVELFIVPALLYYSGVLSLVSVPANALVLPLVPAVMLLGFITGALGLIHPALAVVPGVVADLGLRLMIVLTQSAAALPYAATTVAPFPAWVALAVYAPLTFAALKIFARTQTS